MKNRDKLSRRNRDKGDLKRFVDENGNRVGELDDFYHFMSEMLAYVGGDGMSVKNAAHSIASACAHEITWKHKRVGRCDKYVYSEGVRNIVNKFLKGENFSLGSAALASKMPDLTKIINLMKQVIEEYRKILAAGRKMSDDVRVAHDNLMNEIYKEMYALADEVKKNFTKEEYEQFGQLFKEKVQPLFDQGVALQQQIEVKGYGHFVDRFRQMPFGGKKDAAVTIKVKP